MACVSYVDRYSVDKNSEKDLEIGYDHNIVACNSGHITRCEPGDYVIVRSKTRFYIGMIIKKSSKQFNHWYNEGGQVWSLNYFCIPMTTICPLSSINVEQKHKIFNSRFCTKKLSENIERLQTHLGEPIVPAKYNSLLDIMCTEHDSRWITYKMKIKHLT